MNPPYIYSLVDDTPVLSLLYSNGESCASPLSLEAEPHGIAQMIGLMTLDEKQCEEDMGCIMYILFTIE